MLHQQLKEQTSAAHHALEKKLISKIKAVQNHDDYVKLLALMYGFYAAIEERINQYPNEQHAAITNGRRKASLILSDIRHFTSQPSLSLCEKLPALDSYEKLLGVMYVLEGSTLGGQIIARLLKTQLNSTSDDGFSFFLGYGKETLAMWESFKASLLDDFTADEKEQVIRSAEDTFNTFKTWIDINATN